MNGRQMRLRRLFRYNSENLLVVPLDHSVFDGPLATNKEYNEILSKVTMNGTDAVVVHKGRLRHLPEQVFLNSSIIVHLSASTKYADDPNYKYLVCDVTDAVMRGADCVSVHVNIGSHTEAGQLKDMALIADSCERLGIPLLAMMYARGHGVAEYANRDTIAHAASLAADFGADIVKLSLPLDINDAEWIINRSPLPVLAAGGDKRSEVRFINDINSLIKSGALGLACGRNVFQSDDIESVIKKIRAVLDSNSIVKTRANTVQEIYANQLVQA